MSLNIYIKENTVYYYPILYVLKIIEKNNNIKFNFITSPIHANLIWDSENPNSEIISLSFYSSLTSNNNIQQSYPIISKDLMIKTKTGENDLIATIFYMINCIQEISPQKDELDEYGRYKFTSSYQYKHKVTDHNIVEKIIDLFCSKNNIKRSKRKSTFFISHDIDTIYGSFLQDGFWALKKMKVNVILKLIALEFIRKPHWKNIDKIIKLNNDYDIKSTYFWIVNQGMGLQNVKNADYHLNKEKHLLTLVQKSGNINGLHKSSSNMSINDELEKGNLKTTYNRYHFLKFQTHNDWRKISESKLNFDCSLGFAEQYGFRNSYGKAFQPFDFINNKPYDFIEAPLNFMDGTFNKYMNYPIDKIGNTIIDFYEKNSKNCDFSLLWHNTYFTDYKYNSFLDEYKKIISYIYESKITCVEPKDLIKENRLEW